jgi:hypothetical protein
MPHPRRRDLIRRPVRFITSVMRSVACGATYQCRGHHVASRAREIAAKDIELDREPLNEQPCRHSHAHRD